MHDEYYTILELAERLKMNPKTIRREVHAGRLEAIIVGRQKWLFSESAIAAWLASKTFQAKAEERHEPEEKEEALSV